MAKNTIVTVPKGTWTELTDSDVSSVAIQNQSSRYVYVQATVGSVEPTGYGYRLSAEVATSFSLADDFPGVPGANRLWAYVTTGDAPIFVSHA